MRAGSWLGSVAGELEEGAATAMAAGDGLGDGTKGAVDGALVGKALRQHLHFQHGALVGAGEDRTGRRPAVVGPAALGAGGGPVRGWVGGAGGGGWGRAQVGVVGQLGGPSAGAFGQVTFGQRLEPPGDPP